MSYTFNLSHSRILTWNIFLKTLPEDINCPSKYLSEFHVKLGTVCVSDEQPPLQAFWFYNNSGNKVSYKLNIASGYDSICVKEFQILDCVNSDGVILPYSAVPVLFKFRPLQCKVYYFRFPIILGENSYPFKLSGYGSIKHKRKSYNIQSHIQANTNPGDEIYFSDEHISIHPIPVWSKTETVIFIKNLSTESIIGYSFQRSFVEGIVEIKAVNSKGVLKPKESHMVKIQVISFDEPCTIRMHYTCKLLDHTKYYKYRQTSLLHSLRQQEVKEEFIITEKGTQYPSNEVIVEPMPLNFFKTISLDIKIISITDIDKFLDSEYQLTQLPQFMLNLDSNKISKALIAKQAEMPIRIPHTDRNSPKLKTQLLGSSCKVVDIENIELVRDAMDCMIMNVLNANIFRKILVERRDQIPPYYIQIKSGESQSPDSETLQRERMLEDSLQNMQAPLIAEIFQQLITDSIHAVFQLGCQAKTKIDIDYVYSGTFGCKVCNHKTCTK